MTKTVDTFWKKIGDFRFCMLVTNTGAGLRGRPMGILPTKKPA